MSVGQDADALLSYHHLHHHHVLARPLNKLMFYGCAASPSTHPPLLKGQRSVFPAAFDPSAADAPGGVLTARLRASAQVETLVERRCWEEGVGSGEWGVRVVSSTLRPLQNEATAG